MNWEWISPTAGARIQLIRVAVVVVAALISSFFVTTQPCWVEFEGSEAEVSPDALEAHVRKLSEDFHPRNYQRVWNLDQCAAYISAEFKAAGGRASEQPFEVKGKTYRNVIAEFGPDSPSRIVIGAHYDTCQDTPGADDNASGVAGLLELADLLGKAELKQRVELVAYTLEEPPYFRTGNMGSARLAYQNRLDGESVDFMVALEMIGCFKDEPGTQNYPSLMLRWFYPDTGNFIALIGSYGERKEIKSFKKEMRRAIDLPVHSMCASKSFPMIRFSDHSNYWNHGFKAFMVTDTAFLRNYNYHSTSDTADTLDYERMSKVVVGVYEAVMQYAGAD